MTSQGTKQCSSLSNPASSKALDLYQMFVGYDADKCFSQNIIWPPKQGIWASVAAIGYRSDKWDRKVRDYIHDHYSPLPILVGLHIDGVTRPKKRPFLPPKSLAVLGRVLDIQLAPQSYNAEMLGIEPDEHGQAFIDYQHRKELPWMCGVPDKRMIVIIQPSIKNSWPLIIWSPIMSIEARGIVY
jgi:hypothetical protein